MTLNQLASEIALEQGERVGDAAFVTQLETWIKDDLLKINLKSRFRVLWKTFSFPTQVNVPDYPLPLDFKDPKYVRIIESDQPIEFLTPIKLTKFNFDLEQKGNPKFCWFQNPAIVSTNFTKKLRLHPIPNSIVNVELPYYYYPQKGLTSNTDIPITDELFMILKHRVRMRVHLIDREFDLYGIEKAEYRESLADYIVQDRTTPSRDLVKGQSDLPKRAQRPTGRFRYPFES
jgi:hypothetical protein